MLSFFYYFLHSFCKASHCAAMGSVGTFRPGQHGYLAKAGVSIKKYGKQLESGNPSSGIFCCLVRMTALHVALLLAQYLDK